MLVAGVLSLMMAVSVNMPDMEYVGTYEVTAYSYHEGNGENYATAYGYEPEPYYTVAAKGFEPGTFLFVEGVGRVQVQDTGAFPENVIDLHIGYDNPDEWGRQERKVWIVR
jgi:3D (Asp-Asp-Asp) domain-containing protein